MGLVPGEGAMGGQGCSCRGDEGHVLGCEPGMEPSRGSMAWACPIPSMSTAAATP